MIDIENIEKALDISHNLDNEHKFTNHPFLQANHLTATDGHHLIMIPARLVKGGLTDYDYPVQNKPNCADLFIKYKPGNYESLALCDIDTVLARIPTESVLDPNAPKCCDCNGTGRVNACYRGKGGYMHSIECICPVCGGTGLKYPNSTNNYIQKPIEDAQIVIKDELVFSSQIMWLRDCMKFLGLESVALIGIDDKHVIRFRSREGVKFIIMGLRFLNTVTLEEEKGSTEGKERLL